MRKRKKLILIITVIMSLTILIGITIIMTNLKKIAPFGLFTVNVQDKTENNISLEGGGSNGSTNNNPGTADNNSGDNSSETPAEPTGHFLQVGNYGIIEDCAFDFYSEMRPDNVHHHDYTTYGFVDFSVGIDELSEGSLYSVSFLNRLPIKRFQINCGEVLEDIDPILGINSIYSWVDFVDSSNEGVFEDIQHFYFDDSFTGSMEDCSYFIFVIGHFSDIDNLSGFVVDGYSVGGYDNNGSYRTDTPDIYYGACSD